jgi:hypothetical protein
VELVIASMVLSISLMSLKMSTLRPNGTESIVHVVAGLLCLASYRHLCANHQEIIVVIITQHTADTQLKITAGTRSKKQQQRTRRHTTRTARKGHMADTTTKTATTTQEEGHCVCCCGCGCCGMFECVSDWLMAECVLPWLVARPLDVPRFAAPRLWQIRSVISFGGVCRRLRGVVCGARAVWAAVDIGRVIDEIAGGNVKDKVAAVLHVLRCMPRPVLAACGAFSLWSSFPLSFLVALVLVMPALTRLRLITSGRSSDVPSAELVGLLAAADVAEWRGRGWWPADATEEVTVAHLLRAISSLSCLSDLTIDVGRKVVIPTTFPRSLRRLTVTLYDGGDVSVLFGAGPHNQIRELEIDEDHVRTAVCACPEITTLTVRDYHSFSQENLGSVLGTCKNLQRLCIDRIEPLSFARLESSPCARLLASIKVSAKLTPGSMGVICRCCPAIEELSVCGVGPDDVRVMASLMRLHVLEMRYGRYSEQGPEFSEAFTALGNAEMARPFTRLVLERIKFSATGLFSSRRCSALRELELDGRSTFTKQAMHALATNVRDSLAVLVISWVPVAMVLPLLAECHRLECLTLDCCSTVDMQVIGETCKAPLRYFKIVNNEMIDDDAVCAVAPALAGVVFLRIDCSAEAVLQHIIPRCPYLQMIRVHSTDVAKQLRSEVPKHITVWL